MPRKTKDLESNELEKKVTKKAAETEKTTIKKTTTKKSTSTKSKTTKSKTSTAKVKKETTTKAKKAANFINEYYDLPYRYNQTTVKILAQTPKKLFVYWDISDNDRKKMKKKYGENFFDITKPYLVIHNKNLNYSFEVEINDFANSWYIDINDPRCEYEVELGRKPILEFQKDNSTHFEEIPNYLYIASSNQIEVPNNKVLNIPPIFKNVTYRNIKTNQIILKDLNIDAKYNIYKKFYTLEDLEYINNPSSGSTSSKLNSSQFK